jgi:hypothetical protein
MSQENVEVVQSLIEAFNRPDDDWQSVGAMLWSAPCGRAGSQQ